jgi:NAD(P)-dependent dehydrogenase (short-subunit alcohol dehydrogenase family)
VFDLTGRAALVTGAGRGVGFGIAAALLERGAQVWVNDLVTERAEVAAAQLGEGAHPVAFDVADEIAVDHAIRAVGQVDILVNNAGIPPTMRAVQFREMNRHEWNAYIDVNLYGILNCVKATVDGMCERGWGRVITISSGAGTHGQNIGVALYAAGKGAGISFMRHLAMECARKGVTANTLALGMMEREPSAQSDESSTVTAGLTRAIPVGRLGRPEDVGYACVYLASDEASWITGQTIALNGGSLTS